MAASSITEKEARILMNFAKLFPKLDESGRDKLLYFSEGLALFAEPRKTLGKEDENE